MKCTDPKHAKFVEVWRDLVMPRAIRYADGRHERPSNTSQSSLHASEYDEAFDVSDSEEEIVEL